MMVPKKDFEIGNLVWAKMKGYPFWPGKIVKPPAEAKASTSKKAHHCVHFFGSENYSWIQEENILHHSEEVMQACVKKKISITLRLGINKMKEESAKSHKLSLRKQTPLKKPEESTHNSESKVIEIKVESPTIQRKTIPKTQSEEILQACSKKNSLASLKLGIDEIKEEISEGPEPSAMGRESAKKSEVLMSNTEGKVAQDESPKIPKKTVPKKRVLDMATKRKESPPQKLSKKSDNYSALISNKPSNIGHERVAVIRPLDDHNFLYSSGITRHGHAYYELQPAPPLDLSKANEGIKAKNIQPTDKKIGFIGLGMMGQRLVKNLITSGHNVTVWNRTLEKCIEFNKVGATIVKTPSDVVECCDIVFCCVSGPDASKSLVFGNYGILSGLENCARGLKGFVEMTSVDPITSQEIAEAITHKGGRYLEAPISGSRQMAEDGALLILGAGDRELFTNCESCFYAISKNAYFLSCSVGIGSKMNLIHNMLMGISHAALAEAIALVERCNLSLKTFLEILEHGPLKSSLLAEKGQAMLSRNFATNTSLKYQQNNLDLALSMSNSCEQPMLLTSAANELFKRAKLLHYSDHDVSAVYLGAKY